MIVAYGLLAFFTGVLVTGSSILNAQLGKNIGTYKAALYHNSTGALMAIILTVFISDNLLHGLQGLKAAPLYLFSGGVITVAVVVCTIKLIPRIPVIYTTLSVFVGQFIVGCVLDLYQGIGFSFGKVIGFCIVFLGLIINIYLEGRVSRVERDF